VPKGGQWGSLAESNGRAVKDIGVGKFSPVKKNSKNLAGYLAKRRKKSRAKLVERIIGTIRG